MNTSIISRSVWSRLLAYIPFPTDLEVYSVICSLGVQRANQWTLVVCPRGRTVQV
jgi:hypothetical protein